MKPKTMILMALAIVCGLGASYMTSRLLAERQVPEEEMVTILVAKKNLSIGEAIKKPEELFMPKQVAVKDEPKDAVKDMEALKNKIMKSSLRKGDHITTNELLGNEDTLKIPEGHQAIGVPVNNTTSASGFASLPHSRVNIIHTVRKDDKSYSQVLLENVLVLAADTDTGRDKGMAAPAQVVTVALKPIDVLKVKLAQEMGGLSLSLRKPNDESTTEDTMLTWEDLKAGRAKTQHSNKAAVEAAEAKHEAPPVAVAKLPPIGMPKGEFKPQVAQAPTPEPVAPNVGPKVFTHRLLIVNGNQQQVSEYRQGEDGQPLASDEFPELNTPRPQPRPVTPRKGVPDDL